MSKIKLGDVFGELLVIDENIKGGCREDIKVKCNCGTIKYVRAESLYGGRTKSCGCKSGFQKTHGLKSHPYYTTWCNIHQRCYDRSHSEYDHYGARGIKVDSLFKKADIFINYLIDNLGERPAGASLGRIDNDLGYCPGNLRWETDTQQNRNRTNTVRFLYKGEQLTAAEIAEKENIDKEKFCNRVKLRRNRGYNIPLEQMVRELKQ